MDSSISDITRDLGQYFPLKLLLFHDFLHFFSMQGVVPGKGSFLLVEHSVNNLEILLLFQDPLEKLYK